MIRCVLASGFNPECESLCQIDWRLLSSSMEILPVRVAVDPALSLAIAGS